MKSTDVLVIVDAQDYFLQGNQSLPKRIAARIEESRRKNEHIFLMECFQSICGESNHHVKNALKGYEKQTLVTKLDTNGSEYIMPHLRKININTIEICGVNTCSCVCALSIYLKRMAFPIKHDFSLVHCNLIGSEDHTRPIRKTQQDCFNYLQGQCQVEPYAFLKLPFIRR